MGLGLLGRPGDKPAPAEEVFVAETKARRARAKAECYAAIARAQARQQIYLAKGDMKSADIEEGVKDRRLRELAHLMTAEDKAAADVRVAKMWS